MKNTILTFLIGGLLCTAAPLAAQSNEIALQIGRTISEGRRFEFNGLPGNVFKESNSLAGGFIYNRRLAGSNLISLHLHLPYFYYRDRLPDDSRFNQTGLNTSVTSTFITPGAQVRFLEPFFIQPYLFAGVGYARVGRLTTSVVTGSLPTSRLELERERTWGTTIGGGVDVMLGGPFGLRGEVRGLNAGGADQIISGLQLDAPSTRWAATGGILIRF